MTKEKVTRTILFADICGSTKLYEALGDERAQALVGRVLARLEEETVRHSGRVVKRIGDEILAFFPTAGAAVAAAQGMHEALDEWTRTGPRDAPALNIHVGVHEGAVVLADGDVFGDAVNVAARLVSLAKPRQTLTTDATVLGLSSVDEGQVRPIERAILRGRQEEVTVCELVWERSRLTVVVDPERVSAVRELADRGGRLTLEVGGRRTTLDPLRPVATIGRLPENDIDVNRPRVSRYHARVEFRGGRFRIVDQSSNGTFLLPDGAPRAVLLVRDERGLTGAGWIGLGEEPAPRYPWAIRYRVEP